MARSGPAMMGEDDQETPRRISVDSRVRARRRRHGVGRLSLPPRCRCGGRRTSHATGCVGEPVVRERGDDHVSHDRARSGGSHFPASVSPPARRRGGRSPDRPEDLLRHRRDATRLGPARPMADGGGSPDGGFTLLATPDGHVRCRLTEVAASTCFATQTSGPFASVVEAPERILGELGASGGSVVSAGPRRTIAGIPAECFRASGGSARTARRVEWCFSRSGLLLYLFDGVEGRRMTTVEATDVSEVVSDGDFVVAPPDVMEH